MLEEIDLIESVQRKFTKRLPNLWTLPYPDRLNLLDLQSLEERRLIFDLITIYRLLHRELTTDVSQILTLAPSQYRGHPFKLYVPRYRKNAKKFSFPHRVINIWNQLPADLVSLTNSSKFKTRLVHMNCSRFLRGRGLRRLT